MNNMPNQNLSQSTSLNKKELLVHETIIAKKATITEDGQRHELTIMYGNFILPKINGKYLTLKFEKYRKQLDDFLKTEEGQNYIYPTEMEIKKACKDTDKYRKKIEEGKIPEPELVQEQPVQEQDTPATNQTEEIVEPINIQATNNEIYLKALKTPSESEIKEEELKQKVEEIKQERASQKRIKQLESELEKERGARKKEREKNIKQLAKASQTKDEMLDNFLFKVLSICLIISVCMCFVLIYLYLMK